MTEMVKITFFKRDGVYYGFRETGHAEFDDAGKDIVCAAVSAMTMLVINAIEVSYASNVEYSIDEDTADIEVRAYGALPGNSEDFAEAICHFRSYTSLLFTACRYA